MAEELVMDIKSNIKSVNKQVDDLNKTLKEQKDILRELQKEELRLEQKRNAMSDYERSLSGIDKQLDHITDSIKDQKLAIQGLTDEQKEAEKEQGKLNKQLGDTSEKTQNAIGDFKIMGVSLNGIKKGFSSAMVAAKSMFTTINRAIATSVIGVFALAIASLVQYFRDSEAGASKFKQITSQLGVVVGNVTDIVSNLGKALFNLITGNIDGFKDGLAEVTEGVKNFGEQTKKEMEMANQLEKDRLALQRFEREALVDKAETEKEIMRLRLLARDIENTTLEERLAAMREANKLADEQLAKDLHVANEKLRMRQVENSFNKSSKENLDEEARLQAEVFRIEKANFSERRRMKTEEQSLVKQMAAEEDAIAKAKQKAIDDEFDAKIKANDEWNKEQQRLRDENLKAEEKDADARKKLEDEVQDAKLKATEMGFQAAEALAGESEGAAKAVAVAKTIFNTQQAIMNTMANVPAPFNVAQAIATGVMGAASVQKILSTSSDSTATTSAVPTATGSGTPAPQMMSGAFELGGGITPEPMRAFVVTDEMTNSQNQLANIRRRATI